MGSVEEEESNHLQAINGNICNSDQVFVCYTIYSEVNFAIYVQSWLALAGLSVDNSSEWTVSKLI